MSRINSQKVIAGGLVAGIVMNLIDLATGFGILQSDTKEMMERLHLDASTASSVAGTIPWVVIDLVSGFVLVFAYAAMRPRFGPGVTTALISSFTLYFAVTLVLYGFMWMGVFTLLYFVKSSLCALVAVLTAGVAGAAVYKE